MKNFFCSSEWSWKVGGSVLGLIFLLAVIFVKPIGVSTQFVIFDGILMNQVTDGVIVEDENAPSGYASIIPYLDKGGGKYAKSVANPLNYGLIFVLSMIVGGFLASRMQSERPGFDERRSPEAWRNRFGSSSLKRYMASFLGGVIVLIGARLAGGCTSGHMISGMMQTSLSGYLFALAAFIAAVPFSICLYKEKN